MSFRFFGGGERSCTRERGIVTIVTEQLYLALWLGGKVKNGFYAHLRG